jgi:hypothetical protein
MGSSTSRVLASKLDPARFGGDFAVVIPDWSAADLHLQTVYDRYLGAAEELDVLQELLMAVVPRWGRRLRALGSTMDRVQVDVTQPGALRAAVLEIATRRGPTYRQLVERYGPGDERQAGSVELRGSGPELVVVISVDERVVSVLGETTQLGNSVALQIRRPRIEGRDGADWAQDVLEILCDRLSPVWGGGGHPAEYWAKVMTERPSVRALGWDLGRYLPGVLWLNFFGQPYGRLVGVDRLRSTPTSRVVSIDTGVLIGLGLEPSKWDTVEYAAAEQRVRDHLGANLFFSKAEPNRPTVAPQF